MRKTAFVKISGDLITSPDVLIWLRKLTLSHYVVICVGGGTQIDEEFKRRGIPRDFGPLGRRNRTFSEKQLARNILEQNQAAIQDYLAEEGIAAVVIIPVLDLGSVLCHVNGDTMVEAAYLGFDDLIVVTYESRKVDKQERFKKLRRVRVIGFPDAAEKKEKLK